MATLNQNGCVQTGARRFSALIAMSGLLASPTAAALLSLHLSLDHHHDEATDRHAAYVATMLHGHPHDDGAPEHDHVVTSTAMFTAAHRALAPIALPAALLAAHDTLAWGRWSQSTRVERPPRAGPRPDLQAVLRI